MVTHLGNVRATFADKRLASVNGRSIDDYAIDVTSWSDYYAFGAQMPKRNDNPGEYRYGFNGMEKDDEVKDASGTSYDFGARMYDPRVGRFLTLDPLASDYPSEGDYNFVLNNPLLFIDPDGRKVRLYGSKENKKAMVERMSTGNVQFSVDRKGNTSYNIEDESKLLIYEQAVIDAIDSEKDNRFTVVNRDADVDFEKHNYLDVADFNMLGDAGVWFSRAQIGRAMSASDKDDLVAGAVKELEILQNEVPAVKQQKEERYANEEIDPRYGDNPVFQGGKGGDRLLYLYGGPNKSKKGVGLVIEIPVLINKGKKDNHAIQGRILMYRRKANMRKVIEQSGNDLIGPPAPR